VAQLDVRSDLFRQVWRQQEISNCVEGIKTLCHATGGVLRMRTDAVTIRSSPGHVFYVMFPLDSAFGAAYQKYAQSRYPGPCGQSNGAGGSPMSSEPPTAHKAKPATDDPLRKISSMLA
jgi:MmyB-like transcription regulator ligand binding domain